MFCDRLKADVERKYREATYRKGESVAAYSERLKQFQSQYSVLNMELTDETILYRIWEELVTYYPEYDMHFSIMNAKGNATFEETIEYVQSAYERKSKSNPVQIHGTCARHC